MLGAIAARHRTALGLLALALPLTALATGVVAAPTAGAAVGTCTGRIEALNADGGSLGFLEVRATGVLRPSTTPSRFSLGSGVLTGGAGEIDVVGSGTVLGGAKGSSSSSSGSNVSSGTDNVVLVDRSSLPAGPAQLVDNPAVGTAYTETHVWRLRDGGALSVEWTNTGADPSPLTGYLLGGSFLGAAADYGRFRQQQLADGQSVTAVAYYFRADAGADCTPPDVTAPTTSFTGGPTNGVEVTGSPTYSFTSDDAEADYSCSIDGGPYAACLSPFEVDVAGLAPGPHTVAVRATDAAGNTGAAVSRTFVLRPPVDDQAPVVTFDSGPADGDTVDSEPTYAFSSAAADVDRFECQVDSDGWAGCSSPFTPPALLGTHVLLVRAIDFTGNVGDPVSRTWTLRDVACDDARAALDVARAKLQKAKQRLRTALASGGPRAIEKARAKVRKVKALVAETQGVVDAECEG